MRKLLSNVMDEVAHDRFTSQMLLHLEMTLRQNSTLQASKARMT